MSRLAAVATMLLIVVPFAAADPLVHAADCISFGTTAKDAERTDVGTWFATTHAEAALENPANLARAYPGYGHPDTNTGGDRIPVTFENRYGTTLSGTVYLPEAAADPSAALTPLVFLQGVATNTELYAWWHLALADHGYLVFAFDYSGQGASASGPAAPVDDAQDAITYLFEDSAVADRVDTDRLGVFGHSLGAITSLKLQEMDDRVKAVVAAAVIDNRSHDFRSADIPIQIQSGDQDGLIAPFPFTGPYFARPVYERLEGPRQIINIEGGTHADHTNGAYLPSPSWSHDVAFTYSAAWFDTWLGNEPAAFDRLHKGHPGLSDLWSSEYDFGAGDAGMLDAGGPVPYCMQLAAEAAERLARNLVPFPRIHDLPIA